MMRARDWALLSPLPTAMVRMCEPWALIALALGTARSFAAALAAEVTSVSASGTLRSYSFWLVLVLPGS